MNREEDEQSSSNANKDCHRNRERDFVLFRYSPSSESSEGNLARIHWHRRAVMHPGLFFFFSVATENGGMTTEDDGTRQFLRSSL